MLKIKKKKFKGSKKTLEPMWHLLNIPDSISFILRKRRMI